MTTRMPHLLPAIVAVALLAGCTPTPAPAPAASSTGAPSASASPSPSASATAAPDPDVLFTITATATSPSGAVADLQQVVYKPVTESELPAADIPQLDVECDGWRPLVAAPSFLVSEIDVTDRSGSGSAWSSAVAVVDLNGWPIFSGQTEMFQSICSSVQVRLGATRGMTPIEGGDWESVDYGFGIATEAGSDTPTPDDVLLSDCTITLGADAVSSVVATAWAGLSHGPLECLFR